MRAFISIVKLILLAAIVIALPAFVYLEYPDFFNQFSTMEGVNHFLDQYQATSIFVYLGLQVLQIVVSIIPGQFIQFAGGYAFGFWLGYVLSVIGIGMGSAVAFGLARVLGREGVHILFGEKRISKFVKQLNSRRAFAILFVLFAVPGLPKDLVTYAAGVSHFGFKPFIMLSLIARTPALMGTLIMGSMLNNESYLGLIILAIVTVILCVFLYVKRHHLTTYVDRLYCRFVGQ
ncbi:MAG TPA: VTT domain-containing protein [Anaerovoracaceae bacterium]|nr:VTT domain-containing protein [Anaerovoracaceae bacterium]